MAITIKKPTRHLMMNVGLGGIKLTDSNNNSKKNKQTNKKLLTIYKLKR